MEAIGTVSLAPDVSRAWEALKVAQNMEDAVRNILRPLEDIAEAWPVVQACYACLDRQAAAVDPVIDELQAQHHQSDQGAMARPKLSPGGLAVDAKRNLADVPRDIAGVINTNLLDLYTLLEAASCQIQEHEAENGGGTDRHGLTNAGSRAVSLISMAQDKAKQSHERLEAYV